MKSTRVALWIWYRGDAFLGFQRQRETPTVQQVLGDALTAAGVRGAPMPAGRTDKGVHARMQVVSVRCPRGASLETIVASVRSVLPPSLGIAAARTTSPSFHAQWSADGKEYRYRLGLGPHPGWEGLCWDVARDERLQGGSVDVERVHALLQGALGTRDFIAFHEKSSLQKPRTLKAVELAQVSDGVMELRIRGSAFGRHQVRYLVGSAVGCAAGVVSEAAFMRGLEDGTPFQGVRAPAQGLILWQVHYPAPLDPFAEELARWERALPSAPPFRDADGA